MDNLGHSGLATTTGLMPAHPLDLWDEEAGTRGMDQGGGPGSRTGG